MIKNLRICGWVLFLIGVGFFVFGEKDPVDIITGIGMVVFALGLTLTSISRVMFILAFRKKKYGHLKKKKSEDKNVTKT